MATNNSGRGSYSICALQGGDIQTLIAAGKALIAVAKLFVIKQIVEYETHVA